MGATRLMQMLSAFLFFVELFVICDNQTEEDPLEKIYSSYVKTIKSNSFYTSGYEDNGMQTDSDVYMVVSVDNFGAVGDGITDDTEAFQNAWNVACSSVFPIFYVPQEKLYLLNPINFSGPCQSPLTVQISGTIIAPEDPDVWEELHTNHWLLFNGINNLVVGGGGMINGRGEHWWAQSCKINITNPCKPAPTAITFDSINNLWVSNLFMENSQQFHLTFKNCVGVEANNLEVSAPEHSPNTDGIHISASKFVLVKNCVIGTGDDCISIVSDSFNVLIENVNCGPGHGISIGSLGKGNSEDQVSGVLVDGAYIHDTTNGLRIKTWQGGSGYAQGVIFQNVYMENVSHPIIINQYYCDSPEQCPNQTSAVRVSEVGYFRISGTSATTEAIRFACSQSVPCENIVLQDIYLTNTYGNTTSFCENVNGYSIGIVTPPPCFQNDTTGEMIAEIIIPQPRNEM